MKKLILMTGIIIASATAFADTTSIKNLGSAWKNQPISQAKNNKNDINIVYGGADISRRPTIAPHTTTA